MRFIGVSRVIVLRKAHYYPAAREQQLSEQPFATSFVLLVRILCAYSNRALARSWKRSRNNLIRVAEFRPSAHGFRNGNTYRGPFMSRTSREFRFRAPLSGAAIIIISVSQELNPKL